jgi:hypothetical protein
MISRSALRRHCVDCGYCADCVDSVDCADIASMLRRYCVDCADCVDSVDCVDIAPASICRCIRCGVLQLPMRKLVHNKLVSLVVLAVGAAVVVSCTNTKSSTTDATTNETGSNTGSIEAGSAGSTATSQPRNVGSGLVVGWAPDGKSVLALAVDKKLSQEGCEGLPEPVLFLQPIDGGKRKAATNDVTLNGTIVRNGDKLMMIQGCEGYIRSIEPIAQSPDGTINATGATFPRSALAEVLELFGGADISPDGTQMLMTGPGTEENSTRAVQVDLSSGNLTDIGKQAHVGAKVAWASADRVVVTDGTTVDVIAKDGSVERSYQATDFDLSEDGTRLGLINESSAWLLDVGAPLANAISLPQGFASGLAMSPKGDRLAVVSADVVEGWIGVAANGVFAQIASKGPYYRVEWNRTGDSLAFTTDTQNTSLFDKPTSPEQDAKDVIFVAENV